MITPREPQPVSHVAAHYDDLDPFYREVWGEHVHHGLWTTGTEPVEMAQKALVIQVAERARLRPGKRVVDVGSGYGGTSRILARDYGCAVTAYTVSQAQHAFAEPKALRGNPKHVLGDFLANDLADEAFDAAVAIESTEHFEDKEKLFGEVQRVLEPGGRLVVCAWLSCDRPWGWERDLLLEPICRDGRLPGMLEEGELRRLLGDAGFSVVSVEDVSQQVKKTWTVSLKRLGQALITKAAYRKALVDRKFKDRVFVKAMLRIWLAYATRTMRYVVVTAEKRPTAQA